MLYPHAKTMMDIVCDLWSQYNFNPNEVHMYERDGKIVITINPEEGLVTDLVVFDQAMRSYANAFMEAVRHPDLITKIADCVASDAGRLIWDGRPFLTIPGETTLSRRVAGVLLKYGDINDDRYREQLEAVCGGPAIMPEEAKGQPYTANMGGFLAIPSRVFGPGYSFNFTLDTGRRILTVLNHDGVSNTITMNTNTHKITEEWGCIKARKKFNDNLEENMELIRKFLLQS
jgi:hypothetical protein